MLTSFADDEALFASIGASGYVKQVRSDDAASDPIRGEKASWILR
jgi:hypothetical protein